MELGTIFDSHSASGPPTFVDVTVEAVERGWITPFAEGQYLYGPEWTSLLRGLQRLVLDAATAAGFEEWIFPRLMPRRALDAFKLTQFRADMLVSAANGDHFLDPVQCISLYESLRGQHIEVSRLPIKVVECLGGWTWRAERADELEGPIKAREFARVEHVFVGLADQVRALRRTVRTGLVDILTSLDLSWQVVAAEGCMQIPAIVDAQRSAVDEDSTPVLDLEIPLSPHAQSGGARPPWAGHFDQSFDLREISGCTVEGSHLTKSFGIRTADGDELWSGCCGIGMNRLVVGFLYQHGFDPARWPAAALDFGFRRPGVTARTSL